MEDIVIRKAEKKDVGVIHQLIVDLAVYEKEPEAVDTSPEDILHNAFGVNPLIHVFVAELNKEVVGFTLYYFAYSTWKGKSLYLEDFVVREDKRQLGLGKLLFQNLISEAKKTDCKRMDWQVLDWNEPAIKFYKMYGANLEEGWLNGRFYADQIEALSL